MGKAGTEPGMAGFYAQPTANKSKYVIGCGFFFLEGEGGKIGNQALEKDHMECRIITETLNPESNAGLRAQGFRRQSNN